ncbi:hypothetical protein Tco_0033808 [Tanacetum coccineum]
MATPPFRKSRDHVPHATMTADTSLGVVRRNSSRGVRNKIYLDKLAPSVGPNFVYHSSKMAGPSKGGGPHIQDDREDFDEEDIVTRDTRIVKGKEVVDDDLGKPFKEALKTPLTRRIIEFAGPEYKMPANIKLYDGTTDPEDHLGRFASAANSGEWPMPVWCRMFQQTLDGPARGWFERLLANSIAE